MKSLKELGKRGTQWKIREGKDSVARTGRQSKEESF
jgi:hypothetical protein